MGKIKTIFGILVGLYLFVLILIVIARPCAMNGWGLDIINPINWVNFLSPYCGLV